MGATFSKLWASLRKAWTGGGSPGQGKSASHTSANGQQPKDDSATSSHPAYAAPAANTSPSSPPTMGENIKTYKITEPWIRLKCALGEAPFYEERTNTLRFLDVEKCELHEVSLDKGPESHRIVKKFDISMGCTADIEGDDEHFIFGGKYGYGICNRKTGDYHWVKKVWNDEEIADGKPDRMRGNDGAVDSRGRFWVGFMNDPLVKEPVDEGAVFRLDPDLSLHRPLTSITIPNGTTWSAADTTMFFADSPHRIIYQFNFDPVNGTLSNRRPFFTMPNTWGESAVPDGHCIDEEGYMWTALHGGGAVLRISPEGKVVAVIEVPTQQPTCPAFCGTELVITSAGGTSGENGQGVDEFAGSVFKIDVGVRGLKRFRWKGGVQVEGGIKDGRVVGE